MRERKGETDLEDDALALENLVARVPSLGHEHKLLDTVADPSVPTQP